MKKKNMNWGRLHTALAALALCGAVIGGCTLEDLPSEGAAMPGDPVVLDVTSSITSDTFSNMPDSAEAGQTRASFSGESFQTAKSGKVERIDWTVGDEVQFVRISADDAYASSKNTIRMVTGVSNERECSKPKLEPNPNYNETYSAPMTWMEGRQTFYGHHGFNGTGCAWGPWHPAPSGKGSVRYAEEFKYEFKHTFPNRTGVKETRNVSNGVVYAAGDLPLYAHYGPVTASQGMKTLSFKPAATVFQVTLGNDGDKPKVIKSLCVSSESAGKECLSGYWWKLSVDLNGKEEFVWIDPDPFYSGYGGTKYNTVYADVPSGGVRLEKGKTATFYMYANPLTYKGLSLVLSYAEVNNGTEGKTVEKKMDIKKGGSWYTFDGFKKYNIYVDAPADGSAGLTDEDYNYVFNVSVESEEVSATATSGAFKIKSYRYPKGQSDMQANREPVGWVVSKYAVNGGSYANVSYTNDNYWSSNSPSWVTGGLVNSNKGGTSYDAYYVQDNPSSGPVVLNLQSNASSGSATNDRTWKGSTAWRGGQGKDPYSLDWYDIYGNKTNSTTANCYVITRPGYYHLPIAYGAKCKNGSPIKFTSGVYYDGLGTDIGKLDSPYLGNRCDEVRVIWSDAPCIKAGVLNDHHTYWTFTVPQDGIQNGNTVVGAFKGGVCVWAWLIWITDEDLGNKSFSGGIHPGASSFCSNEADAYWTYSQSGDPHTYQFLNYPLGWYRFGGGSTDSRSIKLCFEQRVDGKNGDKVRNTCYATLTQKGSSSSARKGGSLFYQWGRPVPQGGIGADGGLVTSNTETKTGTKYSTTAVYSQPAVFWALNDYPLYAGFDDPLNYVKRARLWNGNANIYGTGGLTSKTPYDPCPPGYCVPCRDAASSFCSTYWSSIEVCRAGWPSRGSHSLQRKSNPTTSSYGVYVQANDGSEMFLPTISCREGSDGRLKSSNHGFYWSSMLFQYNSGAYGDKNKGQVNSPCYFEITPGGTIVPFNGWVSTTAGMCILPQKEE